jgi:glycine/D-amino acid oxidase-like deaminating enzyme
VPVHVRAKLPPSLFADTARPPPDTPPLPGDRKASVCVIGAGFTGLSAALHLAEQGTEVVVLEQNEPGWGASGRNGGQVNPGLKHDPDTVEADFGPDLGRRMIEMSWNAPNVVFDLIARHQIDCEASQSGTMRAAFQRNNVADIGAAFAQGARRGMPVELLGRDAMRAKTGTDRYLCALLDNRGGHVNPLGYARGIAQAAIQAGATVHGSTPATKVRRDGTTWLVATPSGTVTADRLIIGTNGYTDGLWPKLRRSVVPVFSGIAASEPIPDAIAQAIMPHRASIYELGNITTYYRLDRSNRVLMGGRCPQTEIAGVGQLQFFIRYARRLWPQIAEIKWTHGWSGQLAITPDHYPHIHEPAPGVLVCVGYNGRGVAMSTAMGPLLAKRTLGGAAAEIDIPITGLKEIPLHGLWKSAVAARVLYGRIRDYLHV